MSYLDICVAGFLFSLLRLPTLEGEICTEASVTLVGFIGQHFASTCTFIHLYTVKYFVENVIS